MPMYNIPSSSLVILLLALQSGPAAAATYTLANKTDSVIGELGSVTARQEDTLLDIARRNGLGYAEIKLANSGVDTWLPGAGTEIVLPTRFILPDAPRRGIVLNIPEMRLYYFIHRNETQVITYPLGIGREGWATPYTRTRITQKIKNPSWYPPRSIREEHAAAGDPLPRVVRPGPNNPLGAYALRLGLPSYLIHGTNKPFGIGMRVSHGCIRLYPEDIATLFALVKRKTPVAIINQPYKIGREGNKFYLEAHPFLEEDAQEFADNLSSVVKGLVRLTKEQGYEIDWELARRIIRKQQGIPIEIGYIKTTETEGLPVSQDLELISGDGTLPQEDLSSSQ